MADTTTTDKPKPATKPTVAGKAELAKNEPEEAEEPEKPSQRPPHIVMRALLGFAGLSLLVGFFLPWVRIPPAADGTTTERFQNGLDLLFARDVQGTPSAIVILVPVMGALLSAASFMGFRYAAQTAIGVALAILAYGLYVLFSMFVQFTAYGLWTIAGGTFVVLLLGVIAYMLARRPEEAEEEEDAQAAKKADAAKTKA
ncbi:MAG: hypothetical protein U0234_19460 [Sandaracinus sp.]